MTIKEAIVSFILMAAIGAIMTITLVEELAR
jgi:hypothetical protein